MGSADTSADMWEPRCCGREWVLEDELGVRKRPPTLAASWALGVGGAAWVALIHPSDPTALRGAVSKPHSEEETEAERVGLAPAVAPRCVCAGHLRAHLSAGPVKAAGEQRREPRVQETGRQGGREAGWWEQAAPRTARPT